MAGGGETKIIPPQGGTGMVKGGGRKVQRIKMRLYGNPVKLDGSVIEMARDGSCFTVEFDGPYPNTTFYVDPARDTKLVTDRPRDANGLPTEKTAVWEIL